MHQRSPLPYDLDALSPHISKQTLTLHYTKHHQAYVDKLNGFIASDSNLVDASLTDIIQHSSDTHHIGLFNNAGQHWNHEQYWQCMSPTPSSPCSSTTLLIEQAFESVEQLKNQFVAKGLGVFGSGWVWLVWNDHTKSLSIEQSSNGAPVFVNQPHLHCLVACDVWEHAYYLDHQNKRPDYLNAFWNVINWHHVSDTLQDLGA